MSYLQPENITELIEMLTATIKRVDSGELSIAAGSYYIVGATYANNSFDIHTGEYIDIEELADLAADLEIYTDDVIKSAPHVQSYVSHGWKKLKSLAAEIEKKRQST